ncbi:uncharacterized protein [Prorops nasuta]|uniref:uncharacterized protein isoform X2 n=1 Tax=Prorops nasuta TaxID=863751 RepID=UPI0034D000FE
MADLATLEGVDRYLGVELPHAFLGKDPDTLSIDIDLSDKKLNLVYDPILHELQSEKLLEACEKVDEFILPEFQLDHLDPLALSPDDMMVAGEILPSTSTQPLNIPNGEILEPVKISNRTKQLIDDGLNRSNESSKIDGNELHADLECIKQINGVQCQTENNSTSLQDSSHLYVGTLTPENIVNNGINTPSEENSENTILERLRSNRKVRLKPRIIKKHRKLTEKLKHAKQTGNDKTNESNDGIMAVVAISTDKISNMTQIVINTGAGEQIYQGKTSELIEATGSFPKLPKINNAVWNSTAESSDDNASNSQHEMVISNALEDLGITDDHLQPVSITEYGKVWLCPREDCYRQFSRLYALKGHLLAHYGVRPYKCDFEGCTWAFYSEFKLKRHKETHLKRKDYVCKVEGCNRRFTTIYNLWSHEKLHTRPNRIICQVPNCEEKFQTKRALELHMKSHDQSHAPYVCKHEGCGKRYYSSNALTSHQRCHSYKEIDVKCSWPGCGKVFDKPCRLKAHNRSHTGSKPYLCTFQGCQWAFSSSSKLKRHQKKHTNERKFVCDVPTCGKAFMRSEHLKEHHLTHKEGRYFQCYICDARFSAKSSLYVHIKKHQIKDDSESVAHDSFRTIQNLKRESHCSRVNPNVKMKKKNADVTPDGLIVTNQLYKNEISSDNTSDNQNISNTFLEDSDYIKTLYHCPMEICTKSYTTKASLRAHMLKAHASQSLEQMIMVAPCEAVILNTSPGTDPYLPEPEPPPLNTVLKTSHLPIQHALQSGYQQLKKDQGSARTCLTFSDVWKLKANGAILDSSVGASDVVLGPGDLGEGLLLTEELPSMYYHDDVIGTEYQVLLLDSASSEGTISLRELE